MEETNLQEAKKISILLINPTIIFNNNKNVWKYIIGITPPIGILHIASVLLEGNILVKVLDMNAEHVAVSDLQKYLGNNQFDYIGIAASTTTINSVYKIAEICKNLYPSCKIILGGIHPSTSPNEVFEKGGSLFDYIARGESELTFRELIEGKEQESILGLSYKKDGKVVHNMSRPLLQNLDELPYPAYDLLSLERYRPTIGSYKKLPAIHMVVSRGCPGQCTFCHSGSANHFGQVGENNGIKTIGYYVREQTSPESTIFVDVESFVGQYYFNRTIIGDLDMSDEQIYSQLLSLFPENGEPVEKQDKQNKQEVPFEYAFVHEKNFAMLEPVLEKNSYHVIAVAQDTDGKIVAKLYGITNPMNPAVLSIGTYDALFNQRYGTLENLYIDY